MTALDIERRLAALEAEMASLKSGPGSKGQWWNAIAGVFANNPRFERAMRLGREKSPRRKSSGTSRKKKDRK